MLSRELKKKESYGKKFTEEIDLVVCNKIVRLNVVFFVVMEIFFLGFIHKKNFVSTSHYSGGIFFGGLWIVLHSVGEIILYILSLVLNSQIFWI